MDIYASTARAARCVKPQRSTDALDSASAKFDPAAHPIIAQHIFGIEPFRPIGLIADRIVQRLVSVQEARHAP